MIMDHSIPQRNSPNLQKTGDSHTLPAVQNTPKATDKPNVWCKQLKTSLLNATIHMKHYSLTELPHLKTDSARPNYAWEGDYAPPFQLPPSKLTPQWPELVKLGEKEGKIKPEQTKEYNRRHAVKELSHLSPGDRVYIPDRKENAVVVTKTPEPRSYLLNTDSNATVRRNRRQLNPNPKKAKYVTGSPLPDSPETTNDQPPVLAEEKDALRSAQKSSIPVPVPGTTTRSGRNVNPPKD